VQGSCPIKEGGTELPALAYPTGHKKLLYDATGRKWFKYGEFGVTGYASGIEYHDSKIEAIYTPDGRMVAEYQGGQAARYRAEYFHQDHPDPAGAGQALGNTRLVFSDFNQNGLIELTEEDPTTQVNELEITQEAHYYPFGMGHLGPWYETVAPENKYQYNGKELSEDYEIDLMDYGARWYDPSIGRFSSTDRFAEKYSSMTPYQYGANNPIRFIDINGDSINVADIAAARPKEWAQTLQELKDFTGLELSIDDSGNMTYTKPDGKLSGSKKARKMLMKAIDHKETVTVVDNEGGGSRVNMDSDDPVEQNTLQLDFSQLSTFVKGTSSDLDSRAYGFGINFFHELGHTRVGGRMLDGGHMVAGPNVQNVNEIRRQLGPKFGQRQVYNQFIVSGDKSNEYHAFTKAALEALVAGKIPSGGYVKVPR